MLEQIGTVVLTISSIIDKIASARVSPTHLFFRRSAPYSDGFEAGLTVDLPGASLASKVDRMSPAEPPPTPLQVEREFSPFQYSHFSLLPSYCSGLPPGILFRIGTVAREGSCRGC